jgi:hypothetical protein
LQNRPKDRPKFSTPLSVMDGNRSFQIVFLFSMFGQVTGQLQPQFTGKSGLTCRNARHAGSPVVC